MLIQEAIILAVLISSIVIVLVLIVYVMTRRQYSKHPNRIGRYIVEREFPSGGMSRIFLCRRGDGCKVIVKIPIEGEIRADADGAKRFLEEGKVLSGLSHPHIVGLEEFGTTKIGGLDTPFISMEFIEGQSLDKLIKGGKQFTAAEAATIVASIADALKLTHSKGIFHRDISANNILVKYSGNSISEVKLIDFGIAKWQEGGEHTCRDMMKEKYASPEQIHRDRLDGRSDIFSLAVVFYELLVGRYPFTSWERKSTPESPLSLGIPISASADLLVMKMLAIDRELRVATMEEVVGGINAAVGVKPLEGNTYRAASLTLKNSSGMQTVKFKPVLTATTVFLAVAGGVWFATTRQSSTGSTKEVTSTSQEYMNSKSSQSISLTPAPTSETERFCPFCGSKASADDNNCPSCGKKLPELPSTNQVAKAFCPFCGKGLTENLNICPSCNKELPKKFWSKK